MKYTSMPSLHDVTLDDFTISPYLLRPLRTYEQALADINAKKRRNTTVTPFIPKLVYNSREKTTRTVAA